jgi:hypothetical protein
MSEEKEKLEDYVKKVKEYQQFCQGNEATTKASLIAPLFTLLGWDMANPKECLPEYRADFGKGEKAATPVDWAFCIHPAFAFIVEAKECGKKLKTHAEQLSMYFGKINQAATVKLGIYTNGVQWQFYTDLDKANVMDNAPFLSWDILNDDPNAIPFDLLKLLQKAEFKKDGPDNIRTFAERGRKQNLLVNALNILLEPSDDFIGSVLNVQVGDGGSIETRRLHAHVINEWRPIVANALQEWVKQKKLDIALQPTEKESSETTKSRTFKGKTCPICGATGLGFRLLECTCGHVFKKDESADQQSRQHDKSQDHTAET